MVKNITFSADESLIQKARIKAATQHTTLNELFRHWLEHYAGFRLNRKSYQTLMARLGSNRTGRKFTREEMNER